MKELGFWITGVLMGGAFAAAVMFALLGNTIRIKVEVPSEYNIGGIPSDFTIRGGVNLSPVPEGSSTPGLPSSGDTAPGAPSLLPPLPRR